MLPTVLVRPWAAPPTVSVTPPRTPPLDSFLSAMVNLMRVWECGIDELRLRPET